MNVSQLKEELNYYDDSLPVMVMRGGRLVEALEISIEESDDKKSDEKEVVLIS